MRTDDLPLFSWTPRPRVLVFPFAANVGKVRHVAEILERKRGRDAEVYWTRIVRAMAERLESAGVAQSTIRSEVDEFTEAVQRELQRRAVRHDRPPGAA